MQNKNTPKPEEIQQQTEMLKANMTELNNTLVQLAKNQKTLGENIKESADGFKDIAKAADTATEAVKKLSGQINENAKTISASKKSLDENRKVLTDLQQVYDTLSKSHRVSAKNLQILNDDMVILSQNIADQEKALMQSKQTFDYHKASIDAFKSAMDKLKASNKDFGPVLEDATKGFNFMKTGLDAVKTGFTSVGDAVKTTGFGLLILVMQSVVEYFTKTTEGAKRLKGGIAAISLVISNIKNFISTVLSDIGGNIINAFVHPADTIKKVWDAVLDNIKNRFKGVSVFFDGLFSGNLKKMGDGVIQMGTGVTNGTDKIAQTFQTAKTNIAKATDGIIKAYNDAAEGSDKATKKIQKNNKVIHKYLAGDGKETGKQNGDNEEKIKRRQIKDLPNAIFTTKIENQATDQDDIDEDQKPLTKSSVKSTSLNPGISNEDATIAAQNRGDWKAEFEFKKQKLKEDKQHAIDMAISKGESVLKVEKEYTEKQKQLDNAKLEAQFANQSAYLSSVDKLSTAMGSILGKNTVAAKLAFKAHQAASIGETVINTHKAIMGIWSADAGIPFVGVPKAIAETAVVAAAGATSIAAMIKQKPGFAKGGHYTSDGKGDLLPGYSRTDDTNAYLRSGEAVVVSEAMRNPWARNFKIAA